MKIVIVGGVAGGMSAATRLRRLDEDAEIIVFEKDPYISFANCGLPYHISGEISDRQNLILQTPESIYNRFQIDVRSNHEVTNIKVDESKVVVVNDHGIKFEESYDKLILSMGASPIIPNIDGVDTANNVYSLRNIPDLDKIMAQLKANQPKNAVVIGAGFIGIEVAENLKNLGLSVKLVEMAPQVLPPLDIEMAAYVENELKNNGITVITDKSAVAFADKGNKIILNDGTVLNSDLTILSIGVSPNTSIAKEAGLRLGVKGGLIVDEYYRTSAQNIYAVGDSIIVNHQISDQSVLIPLASPANRQGRQVADIISGRDVKNNGSIGTSILRAFNLTAASTGLNERSLKNLKYNYKSIHITTKDHAGYYPGATPIHLKLIFNPNSGEIYGAQAIGAKGVDKRIDVISTAIKGDLTIFDLPELELSYAPPFGSAKDAVNMVGYAAMNIADGLSENIQWHELDNAMSSGKILLDVRSSDEIQNNGKFIYDNQINIPLDELRFRIDELNQDKNYIVSCHSGQRSYLAERILKQYGFNVVNLDGAFSLLNTIKPDLIVK